MFKNVFEKVVEAKNEKAMDMKLRKVTKWAIKAQRRGLITEEIGNEIICKQWNAIRAMSATA